MIPSLDELLTGSLLASAYLLYLLYKVVKAKIQLGVAHGREFRLLTELVRRDQTVSARKDAEREYGDEWWKKGDFWEQGKFAEAIDVRESTISKWVRKLKERDLIEVVTVQGKKIPLAKENAERYVVLPVWRMLLLQTGKPEDLVSSIAGILWGLVGETFVVGLILWIYSNMVARLKLECLGSELITYSFIIGFLILLPSYLVTRGVIAAYRKRHVIGEMLLKLRRGILDQKVSYS